MAIANERRRGRARARVLIVAGVVGAAAGVGGAAFGFYLLAFAGVFLAVHVSIFSTTRRAENAEWRGVEGEVRVDPGIGVRRVNVQLSDGTRGELRRGHAYSPIGSYSGRLMVSEGRSRLVVIPGNSRVYRLVNIAK